MRAIPIASLPALNLPRPAQGALPNGSAADTHGTQVILPAYSHGRVNQIESCAGEISTGPVAFGQHVGPTGIELAAGLGLLGLAARRRC